MDIEEVVYQNLDVNGGVVLAENPLPKPPREPVLCAMCPDEPAQATFLCLTCSGLALCSGCQNKHLVRLKGHAAVALEKSKDMMCTKHPGKPVEFCCDSPCHELICATCVPLDHAGHQFSSLPVAAERERADLQRVTDEATVAITAEVTEATAMLNSFAAYVDSQDSLVASEGEKLMQQILQKMIEARAAIRTKSAPELQRLGRAKQATLDAAARMRSCAAVAGRLRDPEQCSDAEVYRLAPVRECEVKLRVLVGSIWSN